MEPISSLASVIGLGYQVLQGALKVQEFISQLRGARRNTEQLAAELAVLSQILNGIKLSERGQIAALRDCVSKLQELDNSIACLESRHIARNVVSQLGEAVRHARQAKSLKNLKELLADAKVTLLLAMVQKSNSLGEGQQSSTELDRSLRTRQFQALQEQDKALAQQNAANHGAMRLRSCSVTTTARKNDVQQIHWKELGLGIFRMVNKIHDDTLRTNLQHTIYESMKKHFDDFIEQNGNRNIAAVTEATLHSSHGFKTIPSSAKVPRWLGSYKTYFFGNVYIFTEIREIYTRRDSTENERTFSARSNYVFHPSVFSIVRGLQNGLLIQLEAKASRGWKHTLRYFNPVPDNAPIFKLCRQGELLDVQELFSAGGASPWDVDQQGWTPLHHAAYHHRQDLCQLLLDNGGDVRALTYPSPTQSCSSAFDYALIGTWWTKKDEADICSLIRCLSGSVVISNILNFRIKYTDISLWIRKIQYGLSKNNGAFIRALQWTLENCVQDETLDPDNKESLMIYIHGALGAFARFEDIDYFIQAYQDLLAAANLDLDFSTTTDGRMLLHVALSSSMGISVQYIRALLAAGANPHMESKEINPRNPTQTALAHGDTFWVWRQALMESGYLLPDFIEDSLRQSCWELGRWSQESLVRIFDLEFALLFKDVYGHTWPCFICCGSWFQARRGWWEEVISQVQSGSNVPVSSFRAFVGVTEMPSSFTGALEELLLTNSTPCDFSLDELSIYKQVWSHPVEVQSTCLICLVRVRNLVRSGALTDTRPSDVLDTLRTNVTPDSILNDRTATSSITERTPKSAS